jgi:hypothetical protein
VTAVVTAVYALFTWGLWRETRAAARTAAEQIRLTRLEQEVRLRPYVWVTTEIDAESASPGSARPFTCRFLLNKGPVPAHIRLLTGWLEVDGQQQPATEGERYGVLFPDAGRLTSGLATEWHRIAHGGRLTSGEMVLRAQLRVEYTGAADPSTPVDALRIHVTEMNYRYSPAAQDLLVEAPTIAT